MKTILKYVLGISISLTGLSSCKKTLDIPNPNVSDESNFWKTGDDALKGINGVYAGFYRNGSYPRFLHFYFGSRSDEIWASTGWGYFATFWNFTQQDYNGEWPSNVWRHAYQQIFRANQVITYVPSIDMDATLKARYIAEAKFIRAINYFNLVTIFENIPIVKSPSSPGDLPAQATATEAWAFIEQDLAEAVPALPATYSGDDRGRVTKGAAYAMLGKARLQQKKWQSAADAFAWLVTGEGAANYSLVANYRDNFLHTTEFNAESVFEIGYKAQSSTTDWEDLPTSNLGNQHGPFFAPPLPPGKNGYDDMQLRKWVLDELNQEKTITGERDPRIASTVLYDSTNIGGPNATMIYGQSFRSLVPDNAYRSTHYWLRKYQNDYYLTGETYEGAINVRVIRYADVLLMYAEALNETGNTNAAYQYVDRVRQRAGLAKLSVVKPGLSQQAFRLQLQHERVTELTGECTRWTDIVRWGYLDNQQGVDILKAHDAEFNNFKVGRDIRVPILQSEIDLNPNLKQNPGY